jgi:hypothetical protein
MKITTKTTLILLQKMYKEILIGPVGERDSQKIEHKYCSFFLFKKGSERNWFLLLFLLL